MMKEIERKFLVIGEDYKKEASGYKRITQGYLSSAPERTVRIRVYGDKAFITIKGLGSSSGMSRFEWEKEILVEEAQALINLCEPGIIDKNRYLVQVKDHLFEVDEFLGENEGLVVAEVELEDENEIFEHPLWLGKEVTNDNRYYNASLTKCPYIKWVDNHDKSAGKNT